MIVEFVDVGEARVSPFPRWGEGIAGFSSTRYGIRVHDNPGHLVSQCGLHPLTITIDDVAKPAVGIGGVHTISSHRCQGYGRMTISIAIAMALQHWKPEWLVLFSLRPMIGWYESQGWQVVDNAVTIEQAKQRRVLLPRQVSLLAWPWKPALPGSIVQVDSLPW